MSSFLARIEKINAQGQLAPQYMVESCYFQLIQDLMAVLDIIYERMKKTGSKIYMLEYSQHLTAIFKTLKG